jgi:hypothetical protein
VSWVPVSDRTVAGTYAIVITNAAERAYVVAPRYQNGVIYPDENLTINGVTVPLVTGMNHTQVRDRINEYTHLTGATASIDPTDCYRITMDTFTGQTLTVVSDLPHGSYTSGFGTTPLTGDDVDIAGTIGGLAATGSGDVLTGADGQVTEGLSIRSDGYACAQGSVTIRSQRYFVRAVGAGGWILQYEWNRWNRMPSSTSCDLYGIWGPDDTRSFAVGDKVIVEYDDGAWSVVQGPSGWPWLGRNLNAVWGASASDVFTVGDDGLVVHYDRIDWTAMDSGVTESLHGVWGTSGRDVLAVGEGGVVIHYDGTAWSATDNTDDSSLRAVWGTAGGSIVAAGEDGAVLWCVR